MGMPLFSRIRTCVARWPTHRAATQVASGLVVAIVLSACGGAPDVGETATTAAAPDSKHRAMASTTDAPRVGASDAAFAPVSLPRGSAQLPASPGAYDIRLLDQNGWDRETFELVPARGAGYQTVHAIVVLRGSRTLSPVAGVQPYCATPVRCDYLPPAQRQSRRAIHRLAERRLGRPVEHHEGHDRHQRPTPRGAAAVDRQRDLDRRWTAASHEADHLHELARLTRRVFHAMGVDSEGSRHRDLIGCLLDVCFGV
jgi:hypothetical protein